MKKLLPFMAYVCLTLVACSSNVTKELFEPLKKIMPSSTPPASVAKTEPDNLGGSIGKSMDNVDKEKFSHALDKPLGKSTQWTNAISGITYTVVPTKKITIMNNPFCREYTMKKQKGDKTREFTGTACVDASSNWQAVSSS